MNETAIDQYIVPQAPSGDLGEVSSLIQSDLDAVNDLIHQQFNDTHQLISQISLHIINSGGKRIRPMILLLVAKACGYVGREHLYLAASIEFFHTSTLLHDDVVDNSDLRRGTQTANTLWGSKASILVGDFLFSRAFQLMVYVKRHSVLCSLAQTANVITQGEVQQLNNSGDPDITEENYMRVIGYKTATLFQAATESGALIADADASTIAAMQAYGKHIGFAFQLIDDALDYCADPGKTGKNLGDDLAEGKITLPLIHILHVGNEQQKALVRDAIRNRSGAKLDDILTAIADTGAIAHTNQKAAHHANLAIQALAPIQQSAYKDALIKIANYTLERQA